MTELGAHCKINLGLRVVRRRDDGFHDIETVMVPVRGLCDTVSVEALPVFATDSMLEVSGPLAGALDDCAVEDNICMRALRLVQREYGIGQAVVRLHKVIPSGAGLGGGSTDAAAVLRAVDREFVLELTDAELEELAARLGSDVPFFVRGGAQLCTGRGEVMTPVEVGLDGLWLVLVKPPVAVSTAEAYAGVVPYGGGRAVAEILRRPVGEWRGLLVNDFEESVFARHPEIGAIKNALYSEGALYASMSGSGSAVFGIFDLRPEISPLHLGMFMHIDQFRNL